MPSLAGESPKRPMQKTEVSSKRGRFKPDLKINQVLSFVEESQNSQKIGPSPGNYWLKQGIYEISCVKAPWCSGEETSVLRKMSQIRPPVILKLPIMKSCSEKKNGKRKLKRSVFTILFWKCKNVYFQKWPRWQHQLFIDLLHYSAQS